MARTDEEREVFGTIGIHGTSTYDSSWTPLQGEVQPRKGYVEIEAGLQFDIYMQTIGTGLFRIAAALEKLAGIENEFDD